LIHDVQILYQFKTKIVEFLVLGLLKSLSYTLVVSQVISWVVKDTL